jgi:hypothetical protein
LKSIINHTEDIVCEDEYEAEKLMWILSSNRQGYRLKSAAPVDEKEMIIVLSDDSSHSIVLLDEVSASRLRNIIQKILFEGKKLKSIQALKNVVFVQLG